MIIDKNGNLFEDRRKNKNDRRKVEFDVTGGRRSNDRRKDDKKIIKTKKKK